MSSSLERAIQAIDAKNADDPVRIVYEGKPHPKEQLHAELMTKWVSQLSPNPTEPQLLAARASHLRRWELPRSTYPKGKAGYLRWRREQAKRHTELVAKILQEAGYTEDTTKRVGDIIQKKNLGQDPEVQTHEDALCLVFLQTQVEDLKARFMQEENDPEAGKLKLAEVLEKTLHKMSPAAKLEAQKYL